MDHLNLNTGRAENKVTVGAEKSAPVFVRNIIRHVTEYTCVLMYVSARLCH